RGPGHELAQAGEIPCPAGVDGLPGGERITTEVKLVAVGQDTAGRVRRVRQDDVSQITPTDLRSAFDQLPFLRGRTELEPLAPASDLSACGHASGSSSRTAVYGHNADKTTDKSEQRGYRLGLMWSPCGPGETGASHLRSSEGH